jgi:oligopeptidase A
LFGLADGFYMNLCYRFDERKGGWCAEFKMLKGFQRGINMIREITLALFDINLHRITDIGNNGFDIYEFFHGVIEEIGVLPLDKFDCFPSRFSHIFSSGFASGYYSYLFSEMLADKAFACFEKNALFCQKTGLRFLSTVLERGGLFSAQDNIFD